MVDQHTPEWLAQRKGRFTASEVHKLMGIKGMGKTGETYVLEKVAEELGGIHAGHYHLRNATRNGHGTVCQAVLFKGVGCCRI